MAQLEAREDLSDPESFTLPALCKQRQNTFIPFCPDPLPLQAVRATANRTCEEHTEGRKKGVILFPVMLIQHKTGCVRALSSQPSQRESAHLYRNAANTKVWQGWQAREDDARGLLFCVGMN